MTSITESVPGPVEPSDDALKRVDRYRLAADDSAKYLSTRVSTFILMGVYVAITVGTTTDEMLFKRSDLPLPLLGVGLPIVPFYFVLPLFFLLMHLYIIVQLRILNSKLVDFRAAVQALPVAARTGQLRLTYPFVFSHLFLDTAENGAVRFIFRFAVSTMLVVLPIILLLWIQRQFLPIHIVEMTWWHRVCVLTDLTALVVYWPRRKPIARSAVTAPGLICAVRRLVHSTCATARKVIYAIVTVSTAAVSIVILTVPGESTDIFLPNPKESRGIFGSTGSPDPSWYSDTLALIGDYVPHNRFTLLLFERRLHRFLDVAGASLVGEPPNPAIEAAMLQKGSTQEAVWEEFSKPLTIPSWSDLRYINLSNAKIPRATLSQINLVSAVGWGCQLHRANLSQSHLARAELGRAELIGTDCSRANFLSANLRGAWLHLADLSGVDLSAAFLTNGELFGAKLLLQANFAPVFRAAQLQGTEWGKVDPEISDSLENVLWADFRSASFQGAAMRAESFMGCDFRYARFSCNDFADVTLELCDLRDVRIESLSDKTRAEIENKVRAARPDDPKWVGEVLDRLTPCEPPWTTAGITCTDCLVDDDPGGPFAKCNPNQLSQEEFERRYFEEMGRAACNKYWPADGLVRRITRDIEPDARTHDMARHVWNALDSCGRLKQLSEEDRRGLAGKAGIKDLPPP